jgi:hypothetical protein
MQLATPYQQFIHASRYARWLPSLQRREGTWRETVERYLAFMRDRIDLDQETYNALLHGMEHLEVMPSMRCLMTAGKALRRDHVAGYNCCYVTMDKVERVAEIMYILMCGTGVGFSVEHHHVRKWPPVPAHLATNGTVHVIEDSRIGWATACRELFQRAFNDGVLLKFDYSNIRTAGERLKVFGGRCAGAKPLREFLDFTTKLLLHARGRRWTALEVHDDVCKLADIVVVGGVRRSALISLSELDDDAMRKAKSGDWWMNASYRALANNSAVYTERPSMDMFMDEMHALYTSKSGERGVFSRPACERQARNVVPRYEDYVLAVLDTDEPYPVLRVVDRTTEPPTEVQMHVGDTFAKAAAQGDGALFESDQHAFCFQHYFEKEQHVSGLNGLRVGEVKALLRPRRSYEGIEYGCNPCSEIILRPQQFCNLSEVVVRSTDDLADLVRKVRMAAILGTMQATLTDFRFLSDEWRKNTVEEALLGVSLTGILDHPVMCNIRTEEARATLKLWLNTLRQEAVNTNRVWADKLGIPRAAAVTCTKPSGTVSQLVDAASGIHPRHSKYYIRTVRGNNSDPLTQFMMKIGVPWEPCVRSPESTTVFSFAIKAPDGAVLRDDLGAIEHLNLWLFYQEEYCEHKPSVTITVREDEWFDVFSWMWRHFDKLSGVSILPHSDHVYQQAPYQECTEEEYEELVAKLPKEIDWKQLSVFEKTDHTSSSRELACTGNSCEYVDIS